MTTPLILEEGELVEVGSLVAAVDKYCREHPFFAQDHAVEISQMFVELGLPALDPEVFV